MSETYFSKFPSITYNGYRALDLSVRAKIQNEVLKNPLIYYPQELKVSQRADQVADSAYNDNFLDWLVWMSNGITDPYYGWYMDDETFSEYIIKKYGDVETPQLKIMNYRNNWYSDLDTITIQAYESLPVLTRESFSNTMYLDTAKKFYEPVVMGSKVVAYRRKRSNDQVSTNRIVSLGIGNTASMYTVNEVVTVGIVYRDNSNNHTFSIDGRAQVAWANASHLQVQHVSGIVDEVPSGHVIDLDQSGNFVYGRESRANSVITTITTVAVNLTNSEVIYWSPVSYYDYEVENNIRNKVIRLMDPLYAMPASDEMTKILQE